jgi:ribose 5-phosphate isomerase A
MSQDGLKELAARAALELLPESGTLGLGTGSTSRFFIQGVAELVRAGRKFTAVATSEDSRRLAESLGIPLLDDAGPWDIAMCVDGADEVSPELDVTKGGGGAHTREKIVNYAARHNVIAIDESKLVQHLGERFPIPVEVAVFAHAETARRLAAYGTAVLRLRGGQPFRSDAGGYVYDLGTGPIARPADLDRELRGIPGVVETGLFCGRADTVVVAGASGVRLLTRGGRAHGRD